MVVIFRRNDKAIKTKLVTVNRHTVNDQLSVALSPKIL